MAAVPKDSSRSLMSESLRMASSAARGLRSLGPGSPEFPLLPALLRGCPKTSSPDMQYPLEVVYDYETVDASVLLAQPPLGGLQRWAPLLPPLLSGLSMGEGGTPLLALPEPISGHLSAQLLIKDESRNPTWSHKDRLNLCTVSAAALSGARGVIVSSSGNHGVSAAAYAARAGLPCIVLTMAEASPVFVTMLRSYGACAVAVPAEARWPLMSEVVEKAGFHPMSNLTTFHTGHPYGPEGYKTIAYEIFSQLGGRMPGAVLVPTGYGEQLFGIYKGFSEIVGFGLAADVPRMFSVEPQARGPLKQAIAKGLAAAMVEPVPTVQLSIACTVGSYRGVRALEESDGRALTVTDDDVRAAQTRLARCGHWLEVSAAAAVAALPQLRPEDVAAGPVVLIASSAGFKDPLPALPLAPIEPSYDNLKTRVRDEMGIRLD